VSVERTDLSDREAASGPIPGIMRVLLVEDNPGDLRLTAEALRESASVEFRLTSRALVGEAIEQLETVPFDAVLLDLSLPDSQGLSTVTRLLGAAPEIPIVVLTGVNDEELGSQAIAAGVQEFLVKGRVDAETLRRTLRYAIERCRLDTQLREATRSLALDRVRGDIAPGLNGLLSVIKGYAQLLSIRESDERKARDLGVIVSAADRAAALVRRLFTSL
jgi:DNA-binding NarL/FixJ family response regulator